ncbi:hypothetical protein EDB85DRAFT_2280744 [Lactarius pseudohatsudake]|nr:hypothetical protein EDB85DRAFT_2280744 [Lactarius pseudohatsudake]
MPYFLGQWFAKHDDSDENACFYDLVSSASDETLATIANIEFYHECSEGARRHRESAECADGVEDHSSRFDDDIEEMPPVESGNVNDEERFNHWHLITEDQILDRPFASRLQRIAPTLELGKPPSGALVTGFNAYVALSWSRGRDTIRLLRNFDQRIFTVHPNEQLRAEYDRLAALEANTLQRYRSGEFGNFVTDTYGDITGVWHGTTSFPMENTWRSSFASKTSVDTPN